MRLSWGVFNAVLLILIAGCNLGEDETAVISTVKEELRVDLAHNLGSEAPLAIQFSTLREQCVNSSLITDGYSTSSDIYISVSGLVGDPICTGDSAILYQSIGMKLTRGRYDLTVAIGDDLRNTGSLTFDGIKYALDMVNPEGLMIGHDELYRIPPGIFWGSLVSPVNMSKPFDNLLEELSSVVTRADLEAGYYGHFSVDDKYEPSLTSVDQQSYNYSFVLRLTGTRDSLGEILDRFRSSYPEAHLSCTLWDGTVL